MIFAEHKKWKHLPAQYSKKFLKIHNAMVSEQFLLPQNTTCDEENS